MKIKQKANISLILVAFIWGLAFIGVQNALDSGWQTFPLLFIRGLIGGLCTLLFTIKRKWWKNGRLLFAGIVSGLLFFGGFVGQTYGQGLSTIPNTAFLTALNVVFIPFIVRLFYHKPLSLKVYISALIAALGVGVLTLDNSFRLYIGDIFIIIGALCFAGQIVYIEKSSKDFDSLSLTTIQLFTMSIMSLIFMVLTGEMEIVAKGWVGVLYASVLSSALASVLQIYGLRHVSSTKGSLILAQESMIATILSIIIYNQPLTLKIVVGGILMITSIFIIELKFNIVKEVKKPI